MGYRPWQLRKNLTYCPELVDHYTLTQYRNGQQPAKDRDTPERAGILLGIHTSLRSLFPHNRKLAYGWMTQPNRAFKGATPVELIDERGMAGLYMVQAYLGECSGAALIA